MNGMTYLNTTSNDVILFNVKNEITKVLHMSIHLGDMELSCRKNKKKVRKGMQNSNIEENHA
ncbi:hypothetical protein H5410_060038 [Solanum commersonii]|uniref:Uncharacterized protein n=1 Tax=Solanum commersonii TaxID=4109 RepID=A0A9J5W4T5_SOLCO|nr:hypothetical protein H5410_060038 [Solanum commersonii]